MSEVKEFDSGKAIIKYQDDIDGFLIQLEPKDTIESLGKDVISWLNELKKGWYFVDRYYVVVKNGWDETVKGNGTDSEDASQVDC